MYRPAEIDASNFDKSQPELTYAVETRLMKAFGIDDDFWRQWLDAHQVTGLVARDMMIKALVMYQRQTGDASTLAGNTLHSMVASAYAIPKFEDVAAALYVGGRDQNVVRT